MNIGVMIGVFAGVFVAICVAGWLIVGQRKKK
jgi:hypothetical protein